MRKAALLAAVAMAAAFSTTSNVSYAQSGADLNASTTKFITDAMNPYAATSAPAKKASKKKMKK